MKAQCQQPTRAYIGLGANLGDRQQTIVQAVVKLRDIAITEPVRSSIWETAPEGMPPDTPSFLNAVVALDTQMQALEVLRVMQQLEVSFGRPSDHERNVSRPIDLDLLVFGDQVIAHPELQVPHPRMKNRRFVLAPLCELAPELMLAGESITVSELLDQAPPADMSLFDK